MVAEQPTDQMRHQMRQLEQELVGGAARRPAMTARANIVAMPNRLLDQDERGGARAPDDPGAAALKVAVIGAWDDLGVAAELDTPLGPLGARPLTQADHPLFQEAVVRIEGIAGGAPFSCVLPRRIVAQQIALRANDLVFDDLSASDAAMVLEHVWSLALDRIETRFDTQIKLLAVRSAPAPKPENALRAMVRIFSVQVPAFAYLPPGPLFAAIGEAIVAQEERARSEPAPTPPSQTPAVREESAAPSPAQRDDANAALVQAVRAVRGEARSERIAIGPIDLEPGDLKALAPGDILTLDDADTLFLAGELRGVARDRVWRVETNGREAVLFGAVVANGDEQEGPPRLFVETAALAAAPTRLSLAQTLALEPYVQGGAVLLLGDDPIGTGTLVRVSGALGIQLDEVFAP